MWLRRARALPPLLALHSTICVHANPAQVADLKSRLHAQSHELRDLHTASQLLQADVRPRRTATVPFCCSLPSPMRRASD